MAGPGNNETARLGQEQAIGGYHGSERAIIEAWERFVAMDACALPSVRALVAESWVRCRDNGVDVRADAAPRLSRDATEQIREQNRDLLTAAVETLTESIDLLAGTGAMMLVTDGRGVILEAVGDVCTIEAGRAIHLERGGRWGEELAGTNGIGTALSTSRPVLVYGAEHFCAGIQGWSCAGAPIRDTVDDSIAGLVDISCPKESFHPQMLALATLAARRIERTLAERIEAEHLRLLDLCLEQLPRHGDAGIILLDRKGRILHVSRNAARILRSQWGLAAPGLKRGMRIAHIDTEPPVGAAAGPLAGRLPVDWMKPLVSEGETIGTLLVLPGGRARGSAPVARRHPVPDESDPARASFACIVGDSPAMRSVVEQGRRLAPLSVPVLIHGETGVGKELFARAIHGTSHVADGPFVPFNCGAVAGEMLASELFGYVRGAFTGASSEGRVGRFELADGGTLCLDEVGELPLELQPYLLRVLEEGVVYRVGDNLPRRVSVRLLAMTNRDLRAEVEAGRFRRDLYYRLNVMSLEIPPLRNRDGDVERLLEHFNHLLAARHGLAPLTFASEAVEHLRRYPWPGNVRELRNTVERLHLLSDQRLVTADRLPGEIVDHAPPERDFVCAAAPICSRLEDLERQAIQAALAASGGSMTAAAARLGISRSTLYRKISSYDIKP
ncbi:sigma-54-dependent Fis family transcriptional regulator [Benzoatithermus flavus]|uniref:Sigma-54-dependent Fis family transcriptional regulator n=1 Tax=Benzoatithermus flavus TaxID=3108223 RepID=A0ABU8XYN4_9PROT